MKLAPIGLYEKWLLSALVVISLQSCNPVFAGMRTAGRIDCRITKFPFVVGDNQRFILGVEKDVYSHVGLESFARDQNPARRRSRILRESDGRRCAGYATEQTSYEQEGKKSDWLRAFPRIEHLFPRRSSRDWIYPRTAYLKRADNLVRLPLVCQLCKGLQFWRGGAVTLDCWRKIPITLIEGFE